MLGYNNGAIAFLRKNGSHLAVDDRNCANGAQLPEHIPVFVA